MKQIFFFIALLIIISSYSFCPINKNSLGIGEQTIYFYQNESMGYSDINRLYVPDSDKIKKAFFTRSNLQKMKIKINCKISKTVLQKNESSLLMAFQVFNPEIIIEKNEGSINVNSIIEEICRPVFVTFLITGEIKKIKIDASVSNISTSIFKEIVSKFQFTKPAKTQKKWIIVEDNNIGECMATYRLLRKTSQYYEYEKMNKEYINKELLHRHQQFIPEGKIIIQTNLLNEIRKEEVSETLATLVGLDTISISGNKIKIQFLSKSKASNKVLSGFNQLSNSINYKWSKLGSILTDKEIEYLAYTNTLGQDNWESLNHSLNNLKDSNSEKVEALILKFRALATLFPEGCKRIGKVLEKEPYGTITFQILGNALLRTETSTATNVISKLIYVRKDEEDIMIEFLPALAITSIPTDEAESVTKLLGFEQHTSSSIVSTAQLALGGIAYNFKKINFQKSKAITEYLLVKMKNEQDTAQKLLVLGNTGSPLILPLIKSYLIDTSISISIRANAVRATRLIQVNEVTYLLRNMVTTKDSTLQAVAKETIRFRENNN